MRRGIQLLFRTISIVWLPFIALLALPLQTHASRIPIQPDSGYNVLGAPSVSAAFIEQVLLANRSPAIGEGQVMYNDGIKYGIDPAFALAFFMHESAFGTAGVAQSTLSLGNLRCIANVACQNGYAAFPSWDAGIDAWYQLIRNLYVDTWGLTTIEQIIPRYAPPTDNNDDAAYISAIENAIDVWRGQQGIVPAVPAAQPTQQVVVPSTGTSAGGSSQAPAYLPDGYSITGKPTISAAAIDTILKRYSSPAAGKGQALYDAGVHAGIDPVFALAFFMHDSIFGKVGMARITHSIGNLPTTTACHCQDFHGYRRYASWEAGFSGWYQFMRDTYTSKGITTIGQIVPQYSATQDDAIIHTFIKTVENRVDTWRHDANGK